MTDDVQARLTLLEEHVQRAIELIGTLRGGERAADDGAAQSRGAGGRSRGRGGEPPGPLRR